jgi:hypothetical protein
VAKVLPGPRNADPLSRLLILVLNCYEQKSDGRRRPLILKLEKETEGQVKYWLRSDDYNLVKWGTVESLESFPTPIYVRQDGM